MEIFARRDIEQYADSLAMYLPGGELFAAKNINGSNLRAMLRGLAWELYRANGYLREYSSDVIPDQTYKLIDEWESALGIPDGCFSGAGTIDERRDAVLLKLASLGVQTASDFVNLAQSIGYSVTVKAAAPYAIFPMIFPILLTASDKAARFTILVEYSTAGSVYPPAVFPLTFPFVFGGNQIGFMECLFRRLKPANCDIVFRQVE